MYVCMYYADDNTLTCSDPDHRKVLTNLGKNTRIAIKWFENNLMKVNPETFKIKFLCPPKVQDNVSDGIYVNNFKIYRHHTAKRLGVSIDDKLKFDIHVNDICNKPSRQINALITIRRFLSVDDRLKIYQSFIIAKFNFCPLVWHICDSLG